MHDRYGKYKAEDLAEVPRGVPQERHRHSGQAPITNRYLKRIRYGNTRPGDPSAMLFEVVFDYGEHDEETPAPSEVRPWPCRQDPFSTYRAGFEIRTYRLCQRVLMFHHMAELGEAPCLVSATELAYAHSPVLTQLTSVTRSGYLRDAATLRTSKKSFPPVELGYSALELRRAVRTPDEASVADLAGTLRGRAPVGRSRR